MKKAILALSGIVALFLLAACGDSAAVKNQFSSSSSNDKTGLSISTSVETGKDYLESHTGTRQNNSGYNNEFYTDFIAPYWQLPKGEPTDNVIGFTKDSIYATELLMFLTNNSSMKVNGKAVSMNVPKTTEKAMDTALKQLGANTKYLETGQISNNYLAVAFFATKPAKKPTEILVFQDTDFGGTDLSRLDFVKSVVVN